MAIDTPTPAQQLEPCPFCGSEVSLYQQTSKVPDNWVVRCEVCGAHCGPSASTTAARCNWNTRTPNARALAALEAVEGAIKADTVAYSRPPHASRHRHCG